MLTRCFTLPYLSPLSLPSSFFFFLLPSLFISTRKLRPLSTRVRIRHTGQTFQTTPSRVPQRHRGTLRAPTGCDRKESSDQRTGDRDSPQRSESTKINPLKVASQQRDSLTGESPMTTPSKDHQPLFVLRQHGGALLSSAFYPTTDADVTNTRRKPSTLNACAGSPRDCLFLSGDVNGCVILWDLDIRRPLVEFNAVEQATTTERNQEAEEEAATAADLSSERAEQQTRARALRDAIRAANAADGPIGVLAVGFVRVGRAASTPAATTGTALAQTDVVTPAQPSTEMCATASASVTGRRRFRLIRRDPPQAQGHLASAEDEGNRSGHGNDDKASPASMEPTTLNEVFFYTHCRNQRLYIWACDLVRASCAEDAAAAAVCGLRLLFTFHVPHHGFCPVASAVSLVSPCEGTPREVVPSVDTSDEDEAHLLGGGSSSHAGVKAASQVSSPTPVPAAPAGEYVTLLTIPTESSGAQSSTGSGLVTTWMLSATSAKQRADATTAVRGDDDDDGGGALDDAAAAEAVDTTGMNPMDALIARSVAREEAQARRRQRQQQQMPGVGRRYGGGEAPLALSAHRGPCPLFVAHDRAGAPGVATLAKEKHTNIGSERNPLVATFSGTVSVLPDTFQVKSGVVMRMDLQALPPTKPTRRPHDAAPIMLSVCFESGHVTLSRLTLPTSGLLSKRHSAVAGRAASREAQAGVRCDVMAAVRAFPESAMTCVWRPFPAELQVREKTQGDELPSGWVVATSAEGSVQCFHAFITNAEAAPRLSLRPCWSTTLPKGIGSACVVGRLLVLGCWDGSVRLYDMQGRPSVGQAIAASAHSITGGVPGVHEETVVTEDNSERAVAVPPGTSPLSADAVTTERSEALVTVLPYHVPSAVNEVAGVPTRSLGAAAAFAFDTRLPTLHDTRSLTQGGVDDGTEMAGPPRLTETKSHSVKGSANYGGHDRPLHDDVHDRTVATVPQTDRARDGDTQQTLTTHRHRGAGGGGLLPPLPAAAAGVHVFASASKDGRVALWRVDFAALAAAARLRAPAL